MTVHKAFSVSAKALHRVALDALIQTTVVTKIFYLETNWLCQNFENKTG